MGAAGWQLQYITLQSLVELKLAAGRARDQADVVELLRVNPGQIAGIRQHLSNVHMDYVSKFDAG